MSFSCHLHHNRYFKPCRLLDIGVVEISSSESKTQDDLVAMAVYAIAIIPLILMIPEITDHYPMELQKQLLMKMILQQQVPSKGPSIGGSSCAR